jgi:hypothetical protein
MRHRSITSIARIEFGWLAGGVIVFCLYVYRLDSVYLYIFSLELMDLSR